MSEAAKPREVADGVVQVFLPLPFKPTIVNVYLVRTGSTWTLVDTGMHTGDSTRTFEAALAEYGIAPRDVTRIVCTHHHIDHYGTSGPYRELTHAKVFLHPLEAERAAATANAMGENEEWNRRSGVPDAPPHKRMPPPKLAFGTLYVPAIPDALLADADEIPLGDGRRFEVVWTPGHTPGHCCLLLQPDGILFVGDHLLPKITPHVGLYPNGPENPLGDFLNSHEKLKRFESRLVCPAHGGVYEDHRRRASQLIDFHRVRKMTMLELIRRRPLTPYEVALEAFAISADNRFQVMAATSETLAHLELLRFEGRALKMDENGVVRYRGR
ncbi:MAG TPA: MBL fold metallo-hydrolase [Candidatus Eisenbacteria bacterium]|nr:MBL fold metallo-hydrolase [Candidatus Eisenbacteria bacterium]